MRFRRGQGRVPAVKFRGDYGEQMQSLRSDQNRSWLGRLGDFVQSAANLYALWATVASAITATLAWVASQVPSLAAQGFAAVLLAAFVLFVALVLTVSMFYIAYAKYFRPGPKIALGPMRLYLGQTHVSADKLDEDLCLEIAVRGYNASDFALSVSGVTGAIRCSGGTIAPEATLPIPVLLTNRTNTTNIPPYSEIFLVCEQRVPKAIAEKLSEAFQSHARVAFDMRTLDIVLSAIAEPSHKARLPLGGFTLEKKEGVFVGGIVYAELRASVGSSG
jgi:hypothetical protein